MFRDFVKTAGSKSNRNWSSGACERQVERETGCPTNSWSQPLSLHPGIGFSFEVCGLLHLFFNFVSPRRVSLCLVCIIGYPGVHFSDEQKPASERLSRKKKPHFQVQHHTSKWDRTFFSLKETSRQATDFRDLSWLMEYQYGKLDCLFSHP